MEAMFFVRGPFIVSFMMLGKFVDPATILFTRL